MNHAEPRSYVDEGFRLQYSRSPTTPESQAVQGVGWLESNYGNGWKGAGKGKFNIGAIQAGMPPCDPSKSFLYTDTRPTSSGASIPYAVCFKAYATAALGWADLVRVAYKNRPTVLAAAARGDLFDVSAALYDTHYYQGFGPTREVRVANHYRALRSAVNLRAVALNEKMPDGFDPLVRVMKYVFFFNMKGEDVMRVQRVIGAKVDGKFGKKTRDLVYDFQASTAGLLADGAVGLDTWHVIQEHEAVAWPKAA